ncbi:toprim domain-containing protein [Aminobacter aganoensis]|uniref:Toprim domain-containing protein n=1 Tax=Aminobacter aganoensis TaxID=83264 RepID=A0A7X0FD93_9HYPH|nr:toprim domain-containing protein [Aminobacter aganoensis]MBB6357323.1 hypothetical protein [Aminobacter aganoensis]
MARRDAFDLASRLGQQAEAVCKRYLGAGRRQGNYWQVGDVRNTPGRSMFVRLKNTAKGPAGKWTDAATGEYGDLLDVIRKSLGLIDFADVAEEARLFLSMPPPDPERGPKQQGSTPTLSGSADAARRLVAMCQPIGGTLVEAYLRGRGITGLHGCGHLHFHSYCYYRPDEHSPTETWPAMVAAVTDLSYRIAGAHRTWLAPDGSGKAPIDIQRKAMGNLLGNAVRFGPSGEVLAAGEGIESVLSAREAMPNMSAVAALSAAHLAAIQFPDALRRLYVVRDKDRAGDGARNSLIERANAVGIEAIALSPMLGDFNEDLRTFGRDALMAHVRSQLAPKDVARFMLLAA